MEETLPKRARFGSFSLDLKVGELRSGSNAVLLQEQPLQVLRILVENEGALVSREEIRKKLWPNDTIVEFEHSSTQRLTSYEKHLATRLPSRNTFRRWRAGAIGSWCRSSG